MPHIKRKFLIEMINKIKLGKINRKWTNFWQIFSRKILLEILHRSLFRSFKPLTSRQTSFFPLLYFKLQTLDSKHFTSVFLHFEFLRLGIGPSSAFSDKAFEESDGYKNFKFFHPICSGKSSGGACQNRLCATQKSGGFSASGNKP